MEALFLLAFTLHNLEEGLWLPAWSQRAGKFHPPVGKGEFRFAVAVITAAGYLIAFLAIQYGQVLEPFRYVFYGFVLMMAVNAVFPHLLATAYFRRYAPGTLSGLLLNLPIGTAVIHSALQSGMQLSVILLYGAVITGLTVVSLPLLFQLGKRWYGGK